MVISRCFYNRLLFYDAFPPCVASPSPFSVNSQHVRTMLRRLHVIDPTPKTGGGHFCCLVP
ncbi:hypothetical protein MESS2_60006 [Mesorhizobium metallidurans STM 2683]|uniref:Uncharacterized protein n=1 Tax=Mesorhizobium metallidurans STM 2683 TaxID=1297569 RepID=M5EUE5_9HYPH|nr:hypothetical protein MESS2_60006 [Mesorhizobium metallidurans STM 2683]